MIVENAGCDDEHSIGGEWETARSARDYIRSHYDPDEIETLRVEIMKVLPDGSFTTEF